MSPDSARKSIRPVKNYQTMQYQVIYLTKTRENQDLGHFGPPNLGQDIFFENRASSLF